MKSSKSVPICETVKWCKSNYVRLSSFKADMIYKKAKILYIGTCVLQQDLVHVSGGVLKQFVVGIKDDNGDLAVAQHAQLVGLFH